MTRNETFDGLREFLIAGVYFELLSVDNPVDCYFYDKDGRLLGAELQVAAGFWIDRRDKEPYSRFEIETGALETVKFTATDGMSGQRSAPTVITSTVFPVGKAHTQAAVNVGVASGALLAANANRRYLLLQNQDALGNVWVNTEGGAAVADETCLKLAPGDVWEPTLPPVGALAAIGDIASNDLQVIEA